MGEHWALCAVVLVGERICAEWEGMVAGVYGCVICFFSSGGLLGCLRDRLKGYCAYVGGFCLGICSDSRGGAFEAHRCLGFCVY